MRNLILLAGFLVLASQSAMAAPASPSANPSQDKKASAPATVNPETALKPSMPADQVRKIMGKPEFVKPMKAPDGKAEIWIYRRVINERVSREQTGSVPIIVSVPDTDGTLRHYTVGENVNYVDVKFITEEVIELLIFNDRYVTRKVSQREFKRLG